MTTYREYKSISEDLSVELEDGEKLSFDVGRESCALDLAEAHELLAVLSRMVATMTETMWGKR